MIRLPAVAGGVVPLLLAASASAQVGVHPICPLVVEQERIAVEEQRLAVDLAVARLASAEQILDLVEQLRESDAIERIVYLAAKHDRDVAELDVERQRLLLERNESTREQYRAVCLPPGEGESVDRRRTRLEGARQTFDRVECRRVGTELAIAEVDLAFRVELLESVRDLNVNAAASKQDVIDAERDVEQARIRVEHGKTRAAACAAAGRARGAG